MRFILYSHILYDKIHICLEHHDVNCGSDFLPYCVTWSYDFAKKNVIFYLHTCISSIKSVLGYAFTHKKNVIFYLHMCIVLLKVCSNKHSQIYGGLLATKQYINVFDVHPNVCEK